MQVSSNSDFIKIFFANTKKNKNVNFTKIIKCWSLAFCVISVFHYSIRISSFVEWRSIILRSFKSEKTEGMHLIGIIIILCFYKIFCIKLPRSGFHEVTLQKVEKINFWVKDQSLVIFMKSKEYQSKYIDYENWNSNLNIKLVYHQKIGSDTESWNAVLVIFTLFRVCWLYLLTILQRKILYLLYFILL